MLLDGWAEPAAGEPIGVLRREAEQQRPASVPGASRPRGHGGDRSGGQRNAAAAVGALGGAATKRFLQGVDLAVPRSMRA